MAPSGRAARKRATLIVLALTDLMVVLDTTVVYVALPSIQRALGFSSTSELQWVVNAYVLAFGGFVLLGGGVADRFGRRVVFVSGVFGLVASSLLRQPACRSVRSQPAHQYRGPPPSSAKRMIGGLALDRSQRPAGFRQHLVQQRSQVVQLRLLSQRPGDVRADTGGPALRDGALCVLDQLAWEADCDLACGHTADHTGANRDWTFAGSGPDLRSPMQRKEAVMSNLEQRLTEDSLATATPEQERVL